MKPPTMGELAEAIDVLKRLAHDQVGAHFTGKLEVHFKDGEWQHLQLPPPRITRDQTASIAKQPDARIA